MSSTKTIVSIVIPIYNESLNIDILIKRCTEQFNKLDENFEIICVDDGSKDDSLAQLKAAHQIDKRIKVISLSRNFGHQRAVLAGLTFTKGAFIGVMDGDLQDPPEVFFDFYDTLKNGYDVVYGVRKKRKENKIKRFAYWAYYRLLDKITDTEIPLDSGDFCMVRRRVLEKVLEMPEQSLYLRGLRAWVGFKQTPLEYERAPRLEGESKYTFKQLFQLGYNGIFSFSSLPIRLMRRIGYFTIVASFIYSLRVLFNYFFYNTAPEGFVSTILAIAYFSGVQLICIGLIGEYVYRTYDETRKRPMFIADEVLL